MNVWYNNFRLLNNLYFSDDIDKKTEEIYRNMVGLANCTNSYLKNNLDWEKYNELYDTLVKQVEGLKKSIKEEITGATIIKN